MAADDGAHGTDDRTRARAEFYATIDYAAYEASDRGDGGPPGMPQRS